jgi:hypothetical protein
MPRYLWAPRNLPAIGWNPAIALQHKKTGTITMTHPGDSPYSEGACLPR